MMSSTIVKIQEALEKAIREGVRTTVNIPPTYFAVSIDVLHEKISIGLYRRGEETSERTKWIPFRGVVNVSIRTAKKVVLSGAFTFSPNWGLIIEEVRAIEIAPLRSDSIEIIVVR